MSGDLLASLTIILAQSVAAGTLLVYAALGELVAEKSGVLNLGQEGMMLVGAVTGYILVVLTGSTALGLLLATLAGAAMSLLFAVLALTFRTNQVATGLALTIFGIGLSSFLGQPYVGTPITGIAAWPVPVLSQIPVVGPALFNQTPLVYLSYALFGGVVWFLGRTRAGLVLRATGESPETAHSMGYRVVRLRYLATLFGGACAGLGGGYLSLVYSPNWVENMVAGRGWIALALVVFATWKPGRVMLGAYLFGGMSIAQLHVQGAGYAVSPHLLAMLPYIATIVVLVLISRNRTAIVLNAPVSLGRPFRAGV